MADPRDRAGYKRKHPHELLPFLILYSDRYAREYGLDGLHPIHYELMERYGANMEQFKQATNAPCPQDGVLG